MLGAGCYYKRRTRAKTIEITEKSKKHYHIEFKHLKLVHLLGGNLKCKGIWILDVWMNTRIGDLPVLASYNNEILQFFPMR